MNFTEVKLYENYFALNFHTNTVISRRVCLPIEMAAETRDKIYFRNKQTIQL